MGWTSKSCGFRGTRRKIQGKCCDPCYLWWLFRPTPFDAIWMWRRCMRRPRVLKTSEFIGKVVHVAFSFFSRLAQVLAAVVHLFLFPVHLSVRRFPSARAPAATLPGMAGTSRAEADTAGEAVKRCQRQRYDKRFGQMKWQ